MMKEQEFVERVARLSAQHLSLLTRLTEATLIHGDGLPVNTKLVTIQAADLEHMKALHAVLQAKMKEKKPFSQFLRELAEAEEKREKAEKGGSAQ